MSVPLRLGTREAVDSFGRVARDLRISLSEKCSLRCTYCMPAEGLPLLPAERRLTAAEVVRIARVARDELGITELRLTGGEPLMRPDLEEIVAGITREVPGLPIALTTNAVGLDKRAARLAEAGLERINISLDTVDPEVFARVTRRARIDSVFAGIAAARAAGLDPIKINAVPLRETLDGAPDLLEWAIREGLLLRFVEQMPLDADHAWQRAEMVTADELVARLRTRFELTPAGRTDPAAPAEDWRVTAGPGVRAGAPPIVVGLIPTVTRPFCAACDRTRVTAEGTIRPCLFGDDETDLLTPLRDGADDAALAEIWRRATWRKWAGHDIAADDFEPPARSMGAIGG